ncbi:MAG: ATP-binding protein, partial [Acinetobacter pseudolwoffii]|nr:ATP-binding protein [Acinetobacter pseudolwoffii]
MLFCCWLCLLSGMSQAQDHFQVNDLCDVKIDYIQKVQVQNPSQMPASGWQSVSLPDNWQRNWKDYH